MDVRALSIALGCEVHSTQQATRAPTSQELEGLASESWEEFQERCSFPETKVRNGPLCLSLYICVGGGYVHDPSWSPTFCFTSDHRAVVRRNYWL